MKLTGTQRITSIVSVFRNLYYFLPPPPPVNVEWEHQSAG